MVSAVHIGIYGFVVAPAGYPFSSSPFVALSVASLTSPGKSITPSRADPILSARPSVIFEYKQRIKSVNTCFISEN